MERRLQIAFVAASVAAFAVSLGAWAALVALPVLLVAAVRGTGKPAARPTRWVPGAVAGAVAVLPFLVTFQSIRLETALRIAVPAGTALSILSAGLFWFMPAMTLPCAIALLVVAGLGRESIALQALYGVAGLCVALQLSSYRALRLAPLLVFLVIAGSIAVGVCRFLPWAQPWVEAKAGDLIAPARTASAGLSLTSRLGEIEELGLSPEVALRVWSDRPQYLRARVYKAFNGRVWARGTAGERPTMTRAAGIDADLAAWLEEVPGTTWAASTSGPASVRSRILLERRPPAGALLAPGGVELARLGDNPAMIDAAGVVEPWGTSPDLYAIVNRPALPATPPDAECLDASGVVDVRLRELAEKLRAGAEPKERVRRTLAWLEEHCTYSLKVGQFLSKDPVGEFVFDKRRGYCEYFASAAAVLLRLQDVPARYVVGYSVRSSNREGGHYVVREADAHAWVEAWVNGAWVELDPTPAAQFESMRTSIRGGVTSGLWQWIRSVFAELWAQVKHGGWTLALRRWAPRVLGAIAFATMVFLLWRWRRRPRRQSAALPVADDLPAELRELLARLDRRWRQAGHPRPPSRAPLEHWRTLPEAARVGRELVDAIYRCRYAGERPSADELRRLTSSAGPA